MTITSSMAVLCSQCVLSFSNFYVTTDGEHGCLRVFGKVEKLLEIIVPPFLTGMCEEITTHAPAKVADSGFTFNWWAFGYGIALLLAIGIFVFKILMRASGGCVRTSANENQAPSAGDVESGEPVTEEVRMMQIINNAINTIETTLWRISPYLKELSINIYFIYFETRIKQFFNTCCIFLRSFYSSISSEMRDSDAFAT